ncbi:MAG: hypothetical protein NW223_04895 [Hyphomicrobiaceae bacterium]|nr:hypothetical protein [Hyphomicrobiaceae bacterium]
MSADGTWKIVMSTPIGERKATLALSTAGGLSGSLTGEEGKSTPIFEGTLSGDAIAFKAAVQNPMPLTLAFTGKVDGANMSGSVSASGVGSFPFSGAKA